MQLAIVAAWLILAATITTGMGCVSCLAYMGMQTVGMRMGSAVAATAMSRRPARLVDALTPYGMVETEDDVEEIGGWKLHDDWQAGGRSWPR